VFRRRLGALLPRDDEVNVPHRVVDDAWDDELEAERPSDVDVALAAVRQRAGPTARRLANLAVFALAVIGALAGVAVAWNHVLSDPLADAHAYYEAAARLNAGQALYPPGLDPSGNHIYLYPPLLAVVLRPLALLPFEWFAAAWEAIVVVAFVLLLQHLGVRRRSTWLAVGILGVPIGWALTVAQAHLPLTLLVALGQPWSIAVAANLKLFPALIVLWWLGRRDWEAAAAFAMWSGLLVLAQAVLEPAGSFAYFQSVGFEQLGEVRNISPYTISPLLWGGLLVVGCLAVLGAARTRWGWPVAVAVATLAPPRLLVYMLSGLLAAVRRPRVAGEIDPDDLSDSASVYARSFR
jgi:hypothetical protein